MTTTREPSVLSLAELSRLMDGALTKEELSYARRLGKRCGKTHGRDFAEEVIELGAPVDEPGTWQHWESRAERAFKNWEGYDRGRGGFDEWYATNVLRNNVWQRLEKEVRRAFVNGFSQGIDEALDESEQG